MIGFNAIRSFVVATVLCLGLLAIPASTQQTSLTMVPNVNLNGSDYLNFDLQAADANLCRAQCAADTRCAAYTYVQPGVQGPRARCWLKNTAPPAQANSCCTSGVKVAGGSAAGMQIDVNLNGSDYRNFDLTVADPSICRNACLAEGLCRAFTYVKPGVQGPNARCWLKNAVPPAQGNTCCISGVSANVAPAGMQDGVNLNGSDYRNFDLNVADPSICRNTCLAEGQCRAFTYVKPGVQGPNARCWLKNAVPAAQANTCCVSGINGNVAPPPPPPPPPPPRTSGKLVEGNWYNQQNLLYIFTQPNNSQFTWKVPTNLEEATGTINEKHLVASWCSGCRIEGDVETDANGTGIQIKWFNGQIWTRNRK